VTEPGLDLRTDVCDDRLGLGGSTNQLGR
jgi:hypothetical protein